MEQQLQMLERLVTDYFERIDSRVEALENRVGFLERRSPTLPRHKLTREKTLDRPVSPALRFARDNSLQYNSYSPKNSPKKSPKQPRVEVSSKGFPTHTCIQCLARFFEEENTSESCSYHSDRLKVINSTKCVFTCCFGVARNEKLAEKIPGCTKGRHCIKHHSKYPYANYFSYMDSLSNNAREIWLEMDIRDPVTDTCEWGEVGVSSEGDVFVLMGSSPSQPVVHASFTSVELKNCKDPMIQLFKRGDSTGWTLIAELHSHDSIANAITLSLKSASYQIPLVKHLNLVNTDDSFTPGEVECISDPVASKFAIGYPVPEETFRGPVLEPGEDYSVGRKNDYPTEHSTDSFTVQLKQIGNTTVESSLIRLAGGRWNNLFTATIQISNGSKVTLIKDVFAEYQNKDEEWIRCDHIWVGLKDEKQFFDMKCFPVSRDAPMILAVRAAIAVEGPLPSGLEERKRAHFSLPQPLHFRVTFVGIDGMTASLRYEQGNPPLRVITREMREESWSHKTPFQFYLFADDVESHKRSDVAIYYDEDGMLVYRPAPYGNGNEVFYLTEDILTKAGFQAKKHRLTEYDLTDMKCKEYGSIIQVFAMVDIDNDFTHTLRVTITTPTSEATGYYSLPRDDFSTATITVQPKLDTVTIDSDTIVAWSVPRASKNDKIGMYAEHGHNSISHVCNEKGVISGAVQLKAPNTPGRYEARYYPAWLCGSQSGQRHDLYVAKTFFEVTST